jgi:subtilisin family serine protease
MALCMVLSVSGSVFALEAPEKQTAGPIETKTTASYDLSAIRNGNTFAITDEKVNDEIAADQIVTIMVELKDAPAMKVYSEYKSAVNYAASLREKQDLAVKNIRTQLDVDVDVIYNYTLLFNGFSFKGEYRLVEELNKMDGIFAFVAAEWSAPEIQLYNSTDMVGAIDAWDLDYTGEGHIVAIVDTGVMVDHPAFSNDPENPRFDTSDIQAFIDGGQLQGNGTATMTVGNVYYSAKIPFRWNYVKRNYNVAHTYNDHGTHVAGIAAGNGGEIVGVAKDAQIAAMQVFNDGGGAGWEAIIAALEDCVVLGVDSANLSLGSPCGFTHYYNASYGAVFENLVAAGVNLSMSAGNEYSTALRNAWNPEGIGYALVQNPDYGVTGSPGTWPRSLSVASVDNSMSSAYYIENVATGEKITYSETEYGQPFIAPTFGGQTLPYIYIPGYGEEADFEGYDVEGKIALIQRGEISFGVKIENAQAVGAIGVIIFNNADGVINMNLEGYNIHIPAISIQMAPGQNLADLGEGEIFVSAEAELLPAAGGGEPSDFSSWGTTSDLKMKPEITAPGGNIYSSTDPRPAMSGAYYQTWSGTSMSAPHVTGGMAIVTAYVEDMFPNASVEERQNLVDCILMSTADPVRDSGGDMASVRKQGAGLMDLASAVTTTSYITVPGCTRPKLELGDDPDWTGEYEMTFVVNNFGENDLTYVIEPHVLIDDLTAIDVDNDGNYVIAYTQTSWDIADYCDYDMPETVSVPAGGTAEVTMTVALGEDILEYIDSYYPVGAFVEGFIELIAQGGVNGDANDDGVLDSADALLIMRYSMGLADIENIGVCDVNGDGAVDMADALLIIRHVNGVSTDFTVGSSEAGTDLNVPFLAFYGDWNAVPMFDQGFYYDDYSYGSNPVDNFIGSSFGSAAYGLGINPYVETEDYSYYMEDRNAVSPNDDGFLDTADVIRIGLMRNASEAGYQLITSDGVVDLAHAVDVRKSYYSTSGEVYTNLGTDMSLPRWSAAPFCGEDVYLRAYAYLSNDGAVTTEPFTEDSLNYFNEWIIPIYVDDCAPEASVVSFQNGVLTLSVTDEHYAAYVGAWTGSVSNGAVALDSLIDELGLFEEERGAVTEVALDGVNAGAIICLADYAGNEAAYVFDGEDLVPAADSWSHGEVSVPELDFYGYGSNLNTQTWIRFNNSDLSSLYYGGGIQSDPSDYSCGTYTGSKVYAVSANGELISYDATDISAWTNKTVIGTIDVDYSINEMAYDRSTDTLYIVVGLAELYAVDPSTAAITLVSSSNYGITAIDFAKDGTCYVVDAYGYLCTLDVATGNQTSEIGSFGITPYGSSGFILQCGTYAEGFFFWNAADASITQYNQIHLLAINAGTGEFVDQGSIFDGLYALCLFAYTVEVPESAVEPVDFYDNFEGAFNWELIDSDGDGNNWETSYWTQGLYYDGAKAAVSYSWRDSQVLYPDNWMISPSFEIGEGQKYLSFFTASANSGAGADIDEHYAVYVIPEGSDIRDAIVIFETTLDTASLTEHVIDISMFAGDTIQLAFRHFDSVDEYTLIIDAVAVGEMR